MKKKMFYGAGNLIFENARRLRQNQTHAELILWDCYLKQKPHGYKFRRQHPLGIYIADFYCHSLKLVIELDGDVHTDYEVRINDKERQNNIELNGITMIRFKNEIVTHHLEDVIVAIEQFITNNKTKKPPLGGWGVCLTVSDKE